MVFKIFSYSQYIFPSRIQSSSTTDGLGMLFAMLQPLMHPSDPLTALCQCLSHKGWWTLSLASSSCPCLACWGNTITDSSGLLAPSFSYSVQSVLLGVIFFDFLCFFNEEKCSNFSSALGRSTHTALASLKKSCIAFSDALPEVLVWYRQEGL